MSNKTRNKCEVCNKEYEADRNRLKWGRQTTCSRRCSYTRRANLMKNSVECSCETCGKQFIRPLSQTNHKVLFCSPECKYEGRRIGIEKRIVINPYKNTIENEKIAKQVGCRLLDYTKAVRNMTKRNLAKNKIKSKKGFHIDHKVSIYDCWKNNISIEECSKIENLWFMKATDNLKKNKKSISIEDNVITQTRRATDE